MPLYLRDYWRLIRPGIVAMVLAAMAVAACTTSQGPPAWRALVHAVAGTGFMIVGAVALNQRLEYRGDAKMRRTAGRPLPAGRLTGRQVTRFGVLASLLGLGYLVALGNCTLASLAAASWVLYVGVYTPLKSRSPWQTPVGAVAGAMPVLLGAAVAGVPFAPAALVLFAVVFLWQFPHAMAIAWLYRDQFAAAGVKLATVADPSGRTAGAMALLGASVLLPASLAGPMTWTEPGYVVAAIVLGAAYLLAALAFCRHRTDATARWLLRISLVYLPALLAAWVL